MKKFLILVSIVYAVGGETSNRPAEDFQVLVEADENINVQELSEKAVAQAKENFPKHYTNCTTVSIVAKPTL